MNGLVVERAGTDRIRLRGIDWVTAAVLCEVPGILPAAASGPARQRLFPEVAPGGDPALNAEWRQLVTPELEHLFASAGEIFARDIRPLTRTVAIGQSRSLTFPRRHLDAWMSAINQARLILGAQHGVTEEDMEERDFDEPGSPRSQAILRIHILGYVLQLLVEFVEGGR